MKKGLLLMSVLLFLSGASMAQKVVNVDGKAIIDNRDMPAKAISESKKPRNVEDGIGTHETNKTVSYYFEVMKIDYNNGKLINWLLAINGCVDYDSGDGKKEWRLPTQRELILIWTLHVPLKNKVTDFVPFVGDNYWSATEYTPTQSWIVSLSIGYTDFRREKTIGFRSRCVRDLTPPAK